jgi:TRAP transporter TAXI family solute receptor
VLQATEKCRAALANVADETIDKLVSDYPFYSYVQIPGGLYPANPQPVKTFGVRATVVASADTSADTVYELVRAVFEYLDAFRKFHPAFADLAPQKMVSEALSAPLHEGARRYFKEKGLL